MKSCSLMPRICGMALAAVLASQAPGVVKAAGGIDGVVKLEGVPATGAKVEIFRKGSKVAVWTGKTRPTASYGGSPSYFAAPDLRPGTYFVRATVQVAKRSLTKDVGDFYINGNAYGGYYVTASVNIRDK